MIKQYVERFWRLPYDSPRGLKVKLTIRLDASGKVQNVTVADSSGSAAFDRSAIRAVQSASPLPMPSDPEVAEKFRYFNFIFEPR